MNKFWRVAWYEYTRHVLRWRFLFAMLSVPVLIGITIGISILSTVMAEDSSPIGYVDLSGQLANPKYPPVNTSFFDRSVEIRRYSTEAEAMTGLDAKEIQAFYVLKADYQQNRQVKLVSKKEISNSAQGDFRAFLKLNLLSGEPDAVAQRISEGTSYIIQSADGSRSMSEEDWFNILAPIMTGLLFIIVILSSGGYLLQAVVEEKENRTIEIIITSVSPDELMAGKIAGDIAIGLTQLFFWILMVALTLAVSRNMVDWVQRIQISADYVLLLVVAMIPSFVMVAALMAALGATVTESREAQQISGMLSLPIMIPFYLVYPIMTNPNGALALGLSFFPITAPVTLTMRAAFTQIPTWQLVLNILELTVCAVGAVWLAARTFRLGMLRYGKRLSWREIFSKAG